MTKLLTINLLGPFEVIAPSGEPLVVRSRRARALLACLAMENGESWTRSRLATLLWHNRAEQQGRSSLRQELMQLRKALGQTVSTDWGSGEFVALPKQVATDIAAFAIALSTGDALHAATLWRGKLLQDTPVIGGAFGEWLALARSKLRKQAVECFERACAASDKESALSELELVAEKLAVVDPGNETAYRCLMRCAASRHDLPAVIACYQAYAVDAGKGLGAASAGTMKRYLDEMIEAASHRDAPEPTSQPSPRWIEQINRQHEEAAAPLPVRLLPPDNAASLAVMPFVDLSPDLHANAALADGLTEELTTVLARLSGVFVTARQSAMVYKHAAVDARTAAAELGVRYLLEGGIEVADGSVRVNARLVDGRSGLLVWSNAYEERLGEFFAVRNRIVLAVASQLQPALLVADLDSVLDSGPADMDAWSRLQRAHAIVLFNRSAERLADAVRELKQALAVDPDYAMAQALLAAVYTWRTVWSPGAYMQAERALALEQAARARQLEPENSFVLVNCADTAIYSGGDIDLAFDLLTRAAARSPHDPHGLALLANANRLVGADLDQSLSLIERAMRLSPRDPRSHRWFHYAGWCHWKRGDLKTMEASARQAIALFSDSPAQWIELTCALGLQGRTMEAKQAGKVLRKLSPTFTAEGFFEIARKFYGKRFTPGVKNDYRGLCAALQRALP